MMDKQEKTRVWSWIAGRMICLAGGTRTPEQMVEFLSNMASLDYVPEYAQGFVREAQAQPDGFAAYLSSRNPLYMVDHVVAMNKLKLPGYERLYAAGLLVTPSVIRVIHEGAFDPEVFPQGEVIGCKVVNLHHVETNAYRTGFELGFIEDGWANNLIRFHVSPR